MKSSMYILQDILEKNPPYVIPKKIQRHKDMNHEDLVVERGEDPKNESTQK